MSSPNAGGPGRSPHSGGSTGGDADRSGQSDVRREAEQRAERLKTDAGAAAEQARREAEAGAETARHRAGAIGEELRGSAANLVDQARSHAREAIEGQKSQVADDVGDVAHALRSSAGDLHERDKASAAYYVEQAADSLERIADNVRRQDLGGILHQAEDLARRQPALFIGGAVAAGFAISRFLRSSAERRAAEPGAARARRGSAYQSHAPSGAHAGAPRNPEPGVGAPGGTTAAGHAGPTAAGATSAPSQPGTASGESTPKPSGSPATGPAGSGSAPAGPAGDR